MYHLAMAAGYYAGHADEFSWTNRSVVDSPVAVFISTVEVQRLKRKTITFLVLPRLRWMLTGMGNITHRCGLLCLAMLTLCCGRFHYDPLAQGDDAGPDAQVPVDAAPSFCSNLVVDPGEACDDGNTVGGDGCSADCVSDESCGNAISDPGETCDDGNRNTGDSCPNSCRAELITHITLGELHSCTLLAGGSVKCWGDNGYGQLGLEDLERRGDGPDEMGINLPAVDLGTTEVAVSINTSRFHTCALLFDGNVKCWGANATGQLGLGDTEPRGGWAGDMGDNLPKIDLGTDRTAVYVTTGNNHACAILDDRSVKCWGYNGDGQLGIGDGLNRGDDPDEMGDLLPAVNLGSGRTVQQLASGWYHSCAILDDRSVKCWGGNVSGQLGLGDLEDYGDDPNELGDGLPAIDLGTGRTAKSISTGMYHTCVILDNDSVKCWGQNFEGQLGQGNEVTYLGDDPDEMGDNLPAVNLGTGRTALAITAAATHTCALLDDSSFKCWGENAYGSLGLGEFELRGYLPSDMGDNLPAVQLGSGLTVVELASGAGGTHNCVLLSDASIKCWGFNLRGQLGLGDVVNRGYDPADMGDSLPVVEL